MFIERLHRDLAICSAVQIQPFLAREPGQWHVVSIREPIHAKTPLDQALSVHPMVFEDALTSKGDYGHGPTPALLKAALDYAAGTGQDPLAFQCFAGRSRSTAVALVIIVKSLSDQGLEGPDLVGAAVDILLALRPNAVPNSFVIRLGLEQFLDVPQAQILTKALMREPRIKKNFL